MNRRDFVESVAAGLALGSHSRAANDKVGVGIVGVGGRGRYLITHLSRREDINLLAICDPDQARTQQGLEVVAPGKPKPRTYVDLRKLYENKEVDVVFIAATNHWHSLATIWACQAGKDVYVEKPASYNVFEGQRMVEAARRHNRVVQVGMQRRSLPHKKRAIELLRQGYIGKVYMARGLCYKQRRSMGHKPETQAPATLNWDLFLGPAPMRPYTENRQRGWHYLWDTGNADIGNQGIHEVDVARWGLNKSVNPKTAYCGGGKYIWDDDQETPNVQAAIWDYGDCLMTFEVRQLITGPESEMEQRRGSDNFVGNLFYGSDGYMVTEDSNFKTFRGPKREPGESGRVVEDKEHDETYPHVNNFFDCVRKRRPQDLAADVQEGVRSAELVHMANISYRTGRKLVLEAGATRFVGDVEANRLLTRNPYRKPYLVL